MYWERIISYLTGYVEILIRGAQVEKLINLAATSGLYLWKIRRITPEIVYARIRVHGYLRIREMVKISGCRVKIHHKHGWPFLYRKLMVRKMFLVGAALCGALLIYLSSFILLVKIEGIEGPNRQKMMHSLKSAGVRTGLPRHELMDRKRLIEEELMVSNPEAVWIGISVQGVVARVTAVPRKIAPGASRPCDIVASHDGVIDKVVAIRGIPVVGEGDTVAQGDLLISGTQWRLDTNGNVVKESIAAGGVIEAKVWYDIEVIEPKVMWAAYPQKNRLARYRLRFGKRLWNVAQFGRRPTGNFFWQRRTKRIYRGRNPFEGVELIKDTYQEVVFRKIRRSRDVIRQAALAEMDARRKQLKDLTIAGQTIAWKDEGQFIILKMTLETIREIGTAMPH